MLNLRDLGDYVTVDGGIVRRGLVCHANQLSGITPGDMGWLDELEMATVRERPEADIEQRDPGAGPGSMKKPVAK